MEWQLKYFLLSAYLPCNPLMQTHEEYQQNYLSPLLIDDEGNYTGATIHLPPPADQGPSEYPERVDWRQKGFVTPVNSSD